MEYQQDFNKCEILLIQSYLGFWLQNSHFGELEVVKRDSFQVYLPFKIKLSALRHMEEAGETVSVRCCKMKIKAKVFLAVGIEIGMA